MHVCNSRKGERIKSSGPMAKEANDTVPECLSNVVKVQFTTETELPSSFSGVKYNGRWYLGGGRPSNLRSRLK